ncbi:MAG: CcdB family protein [Nitratireductor sp.]|nr:CcdB family protein [Nitratireductor sp.]
MARYDAYWSPERDCYLIDVQSDLIGGLSSRVVIPAYPFEKAPKQIARLNPDLQIGGRNCVLMTDFISAVPERGLGRPVENLAAEHDKIVMALDLLFTGI